LSGQIDFNNSYTLLLHKSSSNMTSQDREIEEEFCDKCRPARYMFVKAVRQRFLGHNPRRFKGSGKRLFHLQGQLTCGPYQPGGSLFLSRPFIALSLNPPPQSWPSGLHTNRLPKTHADHLPALLEPNHLPLPIHPPANPHAITLISHVKGDRSVPLISKPIGAFFDQQVELYGDKEVLRVVHQDIRWSWKELQVGRFVGTAIHLPLTEPWLSISQSHVDAFSQGLLDLGFEKGDRLGIWLPNTAEWVRGHLKEAFLSLSWWHTPGGCPIRDGQDRYHFGQHQPCLPHL